MCITIIDKLTNMSVNIFYFYLYLFYGFPADKKNGCAFGSGYPETC